MDHAGVRRREALLCGLLSAAVLLTLGLLRGEALWNPSDGVYALTSRELLDGLGLYGDVAAAQPPPVYLVGAGLLALDDSVTMLRAGLELVTLGTALLVWAAARRLTGVAWLAVAAGVATPLLPVMLHENALLTPETLGAPLLLACALTAARSDRAALAGVLAALAAGTKLSFALPALAILLVSPVRGRALAWAAGAGVALAVLATGIWGEELWRSIVVAQSQSGNTDGSDLPGLLAQEAWNLLPLVALAAFGLRGRDPLTRTVAACAAGGLVLGLSVLKAGSYVNVVQVAEPPLLVLAACAVAARRALPLAVAAALLLVAQSGSLLLSPADPRPYTRPFAAEGPRRLLSETQVDAFARAARACPPGAPYPGIVYLAFVADRRVPGDQPDLFILGADENARFRARAEGDRHHACPDGAPTL